MTGRTSPLARLPVIALLLATWTDGAALAQAVQPDRALPQAHASGVLTPPEQVDPGMTRPVPQMPAQSTPVIHPRQLRHARHGTVLVVPK